MNIKLIEISLKELQEALIEYCAKHTQSQPATVMICSYNDFICVDLHPGGMVEATEFKHKVQQ